MAAVEEWEVEEDFLVGDFFGLASVDDDLEVEDLDGDLEVVDLVFFMGEIVVVGGGFAGGAAAVPAVVLLVAAAMLVGDDVFNCYGLIIYSLGSVRGEA